MAPTTTRTLVRLLIAAALIVVGAMLLPRPLLTLQMSVWAIAAGLLVWSGTLAVGARARWGMWVASVAAALAAVAVIVFTSPVVRSFPVILAVALAAGAVLLALRAFRRSAPLERSLRIAHAIACAAGAVLVWLWPDVALLLLGWALAAALIATGIVMLWRELRPARLTRRSRRPHPALRITGAVAALVLVAGAGAGSVWLRTGIHHPDDFYSWSGPVPETPGELLRVSAYDGEVPEGARALRILYSTTYSDGTPALASAVVAIPLTTGTGERTVMAWQHGTTGVARACAPSLTTDALTEYAIPGISRMIERDWVVVATDYPGQGTAGKYPYLIGEGEGRSTLDGVRAARQLDDAQASDRVLLWGHSQGGHATLWAAQLADDYAPELNVLGVAALSAAADPLALAEKITGAGASASDPTHTGMSALGSAVSSYVVVPYADEYDDISVAALTHPAGAAFVETGASRCAVDRNMLVTVLVAVALGDEDQLYRLDLTEGPVHDRLVENIAGTDQPAPVFLGQGTDDEVIPIAIQRDLDARLCAASVPVEAHEYAGRTHMGVIAEGSPLIDDVFTWVDTVLAGAEPSGC